MPSFAPPCSRPSIAGGTCSASSSGYAGLLGDDDVIPLTRDEVRGIGHLGGTILRTTNRGNPFSYPVKQPDGSYVEVDRSDELMENARNLGINALISIGGDGSLAIAQQLAAEGNARGVRAEDDRQRRQRHASPPSASTPR